MGFVYLLCCAIYRLTFAFVKRRAGPLTYVENDELLTSSKTKLGLFSETFCEKFVFEHVGHPATEERITLRPATGSFR